MLLQIGNITNMVCKGRELGENMHCMGVTTMKHSSAGGQWQLGRGEASKGSSLERIHFAPQKSSPVTRSSLPAEGTGDYKIYVGE